MWEQLLANEICVTYVGVCVSRLGEYIGREKSQKDQIV